MTNINLMNEAETAIRMNMVPEEAYADVLAETVQMIMSGSLSWEEVLERDVTDEEIDILNTIQAGD